MATSVTLPPGWHMDYDHTALRCFFIHKPTGLKQWNFPTLADPENPGSSNTATASPASVASESQPVVITPEQKHEPTSTSIQQSLTPVDPSAASVKPDGELELMDKAQGQSDVIESLSSREETMSTTGTSSTTDTRPSPDPVSLPPVVVATYAETHGFMPCQEADASDIPSAPNSQPPIERNDSASTIHIPGPITPPPSYSQDQLNYFAPLDGSLSHQQQFAYAPSGLVTPPASPTSFSPSLTNAYPTYNAQQSQNTSQLPYGTPQFPMANFVQVGPQQLGQISPQFSYYYINTPPAGACHNPVNPQLSSYCPAPQERQTSLLAVGSVGSPETPLSTNSEQKQPKSSDGSEIVETADIILEDTDIKLPLSDDELLEQLEHSSDTKGRAIIAQMQKQSKRASTMFVSTANKTGRGVKGVLKSPATRFVGTMAIEVVGLHCGVIGAGAIANKLTGGRLKGKQKKKAQGQPEEDQENGAIEEKEKNEIQTDMLASQEEDAPQNDSPAPKDTSTPDRIQLASSNEPAKQPQPGQEHPIPSPPLATPQPNFPLMQPMMVMMPSIGPYGHVLPPGAMAIPQLNASGMNIQSTSDGAEATLHPQLVRYYTSPAILQHQIPFNQQAYIPVPGGKQTDSVVQDTTQQTQLQGANQQIENGPGTGLPTSLLESTLSDFTGIALQDIPSTSPTSTVTANEKNALESVLDAASSPNSSSALNAAHNVLNITSTTKDSGVLSAVQSALDVVSDPKDNNVIDATNSALDATSKSKKVKRSGLRALRASLTDSSLTERISKLTNTDASSFLS